MYMGIDQYGNTYHGLTYPRKDLAERLGYNPGSLHKMYMDTTENKTCHVGYIIGGLWIELFEVKPYRKTI